MGAPEKQASPLRRFANVCPVPPVRSIPPDRKTVAKLPAPPIRSISSPTLVFSAREVESCGKKQGRRCRNGNAAQLLRHRAKNGGASSETALRLFRGRCVFLCPGAQSCRTKNRGDTADAAREVDSTDFFAIIIMPPPKRSIPAEGKPRRLCLNGMVAQSRRHHWSAFRLNDKIPPDKCRGRYSYGGTWFECVAPAVFLPCPGRQFRQVKNGGGGPITAPDSNVVHAGGELCRANNRDDTCNVIPGSVSPPSLVFSPLEGPVLPENNPGGLARTALRGDSPWPFVLCYPVWSTSVENEPWRLLDRSDSSSTFDQRSFCSAW